MNFRLDNFYAAPCETFEPYYGVKDDGNVYDPDNIESLYEHVMTVTDEGVHFMMADGVSFSFLETLTILKFFCRDSR